MRKAGVLMPVASLPSKYGIGDFGQAAYKFIDMLSETGACIWQILPLNPLGYGNSPYQPYSSFAGDEIYLGLDVLFKKGLIDEQPEEYNRYETSIEYENVRIYKEKYLRKAYSNFVPDKNYEKFIKQEWVFLYGVFKTFKTENNMACWNEWETEYKDWIKTRDESLVEKHRDEIDYNIFLQYMFYRQWMSLKKYANNKGIDIMGDIPFYVGIDSLDVWSNQENFLLDENGFPTFIAGVPPDYFSATGQRWGNPIYDWDYLEKNNFKFWIDRIAYNGKLFDTIRIDHFRAFDTFWKIPASCPTAIDGEWIEAPGYKVFDTIYKELPEINIVAEDLGEMRPEVFELKDYYNLKGMKIIQFTFDPNEKNNDFDDKENMIAYTGTHDNQTIKGWYESQKQSTRIKSRIALFKMGYKHPQINKNFVEFTLNNVAEIAVIPMQDILGLSDEGRLNTPGTVGSPNWNWKMATYKDAINQFAWFKECVKKSKRS